VTVAAWRREPGDYPVAATTRTLRLPGLDVVVDACRIYAGYGRDVIDPPVPVMQSAPYNGAPAFIEFRRRLDRALCHNSRYTQTASETVGRTSGGGPLNDVRTEHPK